MCLESKLGKEVAKTYLNRDFLFAFYCIKDNWPQPEFFRYARFPVKLPRVFWGREEGKVSVAPWCLESLHLCLESVKHLGHILLYLMENLLNCKKLCSVKKYISDAVFHLLTRFKKTLRKAKCPISI